MAQRWHLCRRCETHWSELSPFRVTVDLVRPFEGCSADTLAVQAIACGLWGRQMDDAAVTVSFRRRSGERVDGRACRTVPIELLESAAPWRTFRWYKGQKHPRHLLVCDGARPCDLRVAPGIGEAALRGFRCCRAVHRGSALPTESRSGWEAPQAHPGLPAGHGAGADGRGCQATAPAVWTRRVVESRGWHGEPREARTDSYTEPGPVNLQTL